MTNKEELAYLLDLVEEAMKWNSDDGAHAIKAEVWMRIHKLTGRDEPSEVKQPAKVMTFAQWSYINRTMLKDLDDDQRRIEYAKYKDPTADSLSLMAAVVSPPDCPSPVGGAATL